MQSKKKQKTHELFYPSTDNSEIRGVAYYVILLRQGVWGTWVKPRWGFGGGGGGRSTP